MSILTERFNLSEDVSPRSSGDQVTAARASGTEGYAQEAPELLERYESIAFADVHAGVLHLMPSPPCRILDIGSGTGRDAAAFAAMGHSVVAVEPTDELRMRAVALHPSSNIEWVNDSLPDLAAVAARGEEFDLVMLTAVWMHLDAEQRRRAMPRVARLLRSGGTMIMSLRHGPVPRGRRMFDVSADETIALAQAEALKVAHNTSGPSAFAWNKGVTWTRLAFKRVRGSA